MMEMKERECWDCKYLSISIYNISSFPEGSSSSGKCDYGHWEAQPSDEPEGYVSRAVECEDFVHHLDDSRVWAMVAQSRNN